MHAGRRLAACSIGLLLIMFKELQELKCSTMLWLLECFEYIVTLKYDACILFPSWMGLQYLPLHCRNCEGSSGSMKALRDTCQGCQCSVPDSCQRLAFTWSCPGIQGHQESKVLALEAVGLCWANWEGSPQLLPRASRAGKAPAMAPARVRRSGPSYIPSGLADHGNTHYQVQ